jgi:uncharacterized glyoxalase superfamily protein PhnB
MTDPFEQLRLPDEPRAPRASFARALRARLLDALDLDPTDVTVGLPERNPPMSTPTSTAPSTSGRTPGAPSQLAPPTSLQAYLIVDDGVAAIDFYGRAFGAVEAFRVVGDDGRVGHAELAMGEVTIMLADEYPEIGAVSPATLGGTAVSLYVTVPDCDAVHDRAVAAGATSERAPADQPHGNRTATIRDPFGHRWMLSQPLEPFDLDTYAQREDREFRVERGPGAEPSGQA